LWSCPHDHRALERREERLHCPGCRRTYDAADGIAVFAEPSAPPAGASVALDELEALLERLPSDEAANEFCRRHGCTRPVVTAGWASFVSPSGTGHVLEIGSGFGDGLLALSPRAARVTSILPARPSARIVARHARDAGRANVTVAVVDDLTRLPLADGSLEALAMDDAAARGFELDGASLPALAAEWKRVLAPGGRLLLGLENAWVRGLVRRGPQSLDRCLKRALPARSRGLPSLSRVAGSLVRQGFGRPEIRAPLPDEHAPRILVPQDDRPVLRYFLRNLVRRNSLAARAGATAAQAAVALGLFRHLVPYRFLVAVRPRT
jgi:SAM-dependent methyltransferase